MKKTIENLGKFISTAARRLARAKALARSVRPVVESLEGRQLLSSVSIAGGTINVQAANGNDTVLISHDASNNTLLDVTVNGTMTQYPSGWASRIAVQLGAGTDLVKVSSANGPVWQHLVVTGGSGSDTVYGSQNSCWIFGANGPITFVGNGGDYVAGGSGGATVYDPSGATLVNATLMPGAQPPTTAQPAVAQAAVAQAAVAQVAVAAAVPAPTPTPTPAPTATASPAGFFPVGVWLQPASSFATWKARGVNTLVGYTGEGGPTIAQWSADAKALGLDYIRVPSPNPASDIGDPNLLAWLNPTDEPEGSGVSAAAINAYNASLKAVDPNIPIMTNFDGGYVVGYQGNVTAAQYAAYTSGSNWISNDIYPVTGWGLPNQLGLVGQAVSTLSADSGGKRQFAFIEASDANLSWVPGDQAATPAQMTAEIWDAVIHGATGLTFFPQQIGGWFEDDATTPAVDAEIAQQSALLQQYGAALTSAPSTSVSFSSASPLEATTRVYGGKTYVFVLNLSSQAVYQSMNVTGVNPYASATVSNQNRTVQLSNGSFTDYVGADSMNVYVI